MRRTAHDWMPMIGREVRRKPSKPLPEGWHRISPAKPRTHHYSYSNEASQGALICETPGFPDAYDPKTCEFHCAYSDRMYGWDADRFNRACQLAGGGDQVWAYRLPALGPEHLREFAQVALNTMTLPKHVRVVHHFNVSNGYSCPTVEAITRKEGAK